MSTVTMANLASNCATDWHVPHVYRHVWTVANQHVHREIWRCVCGCGRERVHETRWRDRQVRTYHRAREQ